MAVAISGSSAGTFISTKGFAQKSKNATSWESYVRVSVQRGAPLPSRKLVSLRVAAGRPNFRAGVVSRNGAVKQLFTEGDDQDALQGKNSTVQFLDLERESSGKAIVLEAVREFENQLEDKAKAVLELNNDTSVFLIGMMASGKSTVGRIVADALTYQFFDSDHVIEQYVGGLPVKDIFRERSEGGFRELETRALRELTSITSLVVATGGGAVVRRENWAYLQAGITVWLDVPIEDLAKRVTAVGTESRPLLGAECGAYDQAFSRLSKLMVDRGPHYKQANCRLSFQELAYMLKLKDVSELTPTAIAVQVLEEIRKYLDGRGVFVQPVGY